MVSGAVIGIISFILVMFIMSILWGVIDHLLDLSPDKYYNPTWINKVMWKLQGVKRP